MNPIHSGAVLLAPAGSAVPATFRQAGVDPARHASLLAAIQRMRGSVYLRDGAIGEREIAPDGRHKLEIDDESWHLLLLNGSGSVYGCARYLPYDNSVDIGQLRIVRNPLAACPRWGSWFQRAVEFEVAAARRKRMSYGEVGGWVIEEDRRCTVEALRIALSMYALAEALGGAVVLATATRRHNSAGILRRIGARPLGYHGVELPPYHDPRYGCEMEMLRFESCSPDPKYLRRALEVKESLGAVPVICHAERKRVAPTYPSGIPAASDTSSAMRWSMCDDGAMQAAAAS